jgi:hypothetical protein
VENIESFQDKTAVQTIPSAGTLRKSGRPWRLLALMFALSPAMVAALVTPPDLNPGDAYRLVFVTSGTRSATSSNIGDYDTFVNAAANGAGSILQPLGLTWLAIASTPTVSAFDHIGGLFTVPVYRSDGVRVDNGNLWSGSLAAPIFVDEFDQELTGDVWTGSKGNGLAASPLGGAETLVAVPISTFGTNNVSTIGWIQGGVNFQTISLSISLYGISSSDLVVPAAAVPEPASFNGILLGGMALLLVKRYRGRVTCSSRAFSGVRIPQRESARAIILICGRFPTGSQL